MIKFIKEQFKLTCDFYKTELHKPFLILLAVFMIGIALSCFAFNFFSDERDEFLLITFSAIEDSGILDDVNSELDFSIMLLFNNARACFIAMAIGLVPFVFLPFFPFLVNSAIVGLVLSGFENPLMLFLTGIMPHGIFELPAIIISVTTGFVLCKKATKKFLRHKIYFRQYCFDSIRVFCFFVIPALILAAIIESFVTPHIMGLVL